MHFQGIDPRLSVSFQYPQAWRLQEERGTIDPYSEVRLLGPRNPEDTYTAAIVVRASPLPNDGGKHPSASALERHYREHLLPGAVVEHENAVTVGGVHGKRVIVSYTIPPLHQRGLKPIPIPVKTQAIFLEKGSHVYEMSYSADAREFDQHAKVFGRVLKTFRF